MFDQGQELLEAGPGLGPRHAVEAGLEEEELPAGLLAVEGGVLEGHPDPQPDLVGLVGHVEAGDPGPTGGGGDQRAQHPHERRLARPVRAEEAVDLPGVDLEVDTGHGLGLPEVPPDPFAHDRRISHRAKLPRE